jgi:Family of unknown function (DUF6599)
MSRCLRLLPALLIPALAAAAIWPENLGSFHRTSVEPARFQSDQGLWDEYGFEQGEAAHYQGAGEQFTATAWRFQDSTAAMAAFEFLRPPDSRPSDVGQLAAQTPASLLIAHGNYVLRFEGYRPGTPALDAIVEGLEQVDNTPLPLLMDDLPSQGLVPNSERYVVGPAGLQKFDPGIAPSKAAFHLGAEAALGTYHTPQGDMTMAIFEYPTPQIARLQTAQFQQIPGAMAKRSGPLVAVILSPPNPDAAERLLALVRYQGTITLDERVPSRRDNIGNLVINAFILIGILLVLSAAGGLAVGGVRAFMHRGGREGLGESMTILHLSDR